MVNMVRLTKYAELSGLTERAMYRKMQDGKWAEGVHYFKDPDGKIWINIAAVEQWVEKGIQGALAQAS